MNVQQLKYIVALNRFRNFARAAEACQVSQPTLSCYACETGGRTGYPYLRTKQ